MSEQAHKPRRGVVVAFVVLLVPTFCAGVWLGRMPPETGSTPPVIASVEPVKSGAVPAALAACQKKLARRKKLPAPPVSSSSGVPDTSAGAEPPVEPMEALRSHIKTCRRNERLHGAEICRSVRLHLDALLGLPENDVLCIQRVRVADEHRHNGVSHAVWVGGAFSGAERTRSCTMPALRPSPALRAVRNLQEMMEATP